MSIVIIDYGSGNIASVFNMVRREGGLAVISKNPDIVRSAEKLILPGVGAFDHGVQQLRDLGLFEPIRDTVTAGVPILGICLGMQLLGGRSEEGRAVGMELIDANFRRFEFGTDSALRIPHVGWNHISIAKHNPLVRADRGEQRFYFTHSYHAVCAREEDVLATTNYGYPFAAAYSRDNVFGVQFHPEKSHRFGMALVKNFLALQ